MVRHISLVLSICICALILVCCQQTNSPIFESGIEGQVYEIGGSAVPAGWIPPPLKGVRTIVVSNSNKVDLQLLTTDSLGAFKISLRPGSYFLLVTDSMRSQGLNGPFVVARDQITSVKVYHDNGMR